MSRLGLRLTLQGHLVLEQAADAPGLDEAVAARLTPVFTQGSGQGYLFRTLPDRAIRFSVEGMADGVHLGWVRPGQVTMGLR